MKKTMAIALAAILAVSLFTPVAAQARNTNRQPGGVVAFFVGCCFGLRAGTEWNEGADLHWREWGTIVPFVGFFITIWNGVDCAAGMTSHQFADQYGANWY